jgi:hypothetical protein
MESVQFHQDASPHQVERVSVPPPLGALVGEPHRLVDDLEPAAQVRSTGPSVDAQVQRSMISAGAPQLGCGQ